MANRNTSNPATRVGELRRLLAAKQFVRIIEAHSGLSAMVGEGAALHTDDGLLTYDGLWESSLTDSAVKGWPDIELLSVDSRLHTIDEILQVTTKPLIVDGDTGKSPTEFQYLVRRLERLGVSAVIVEDKVYPKRNSLDPTAKQTLEDPTVFAQKLERGKGAAIDSDFMIISRIESLIAGTGLDDALGRAKAYVLAGVDGVMIHSQKSDPTEILAFAEAYGPLCERLGRRPPLICVPTTYNLITDQALADHGFNIIIHANHLLRASYKAMQEAARAILETDRSFEADAFCAPTSEIFSVVGFEHIKEQDRRDSRADRLSIIIPAAGKDRVFPETPKSLIKVAGRPVLDYQIESIRKAGLTNNQIVVVRGHEAGQFTRNDILYAENERYLDTRSLHSLFCAEDAMAEGFLLVYSDLLFNDELVRKLVNSEGDIVLLLDRSYQYHRHGVDKNLDLVASAERGSLGRRLRPMSLVDIARIGKGIPQGIAEYEFVGMAHVSERGAEVLRKVYTDTKSAALSPFHEAPTFEQAQITDLFQEVIARGFQVRGLEVHMGWIEVHNRRDVRSAEHELLINLNAVEPTVWP
jgi:phosphoenolpyruvate phosphomutase